MVVRPNKHGEGPRPARRRGVLVAESDASVVENMRQELVALRVGLVSVPGNVAALEALARGEVPDVLVVSESDDRMTGQQLMQHLRANADLATVYVLMLSD